MALCCIWECRVWFVLKKTPEERLKQKHDHVEFILDDGVRVVFNDARRFGFLKPLHRDSWDTDESFKAMGPEPLSNGFRSSIFEERMKGLRSPIKTALLNQKIVAGVGNIYACEALYRAGIHPERPAG